MNRPNETGALERLRKKDRGSCFSPRISDRSEWEKGRETSSKEIFTLAVAFVSDFCPRAAWQPGIPNGAYRGHFSRRSASNDRNPFAAD